MDDKPTYEELEQQVRDLKKAESALKKDEIRISRMRDILSESQRIAHIGSFEYIAATQETVWSDEEFRIYGIDPSQGSPDYQDMLENSIHPDDAELLDRTFKKAFANGEVYELVHKIVRPDGTVRIVHDVAHPYFDDDGNLYRYIGVTLDITERRQAEERLKQSKILLESSIESPREMIILSLDRDYRYLYFNKVHREVMNRSYGASPLIGDCIFDHVSVAEDIDTLKGHYDRALAGDGHIAIGEYGEGRRRSYYEVQYNPIYDDANEIVGLTAFARNITDQKMAEKQQAEMQQQLEKRNTFIEMILESLPIGLGVNDIDSGEVTYLNNKFAEIYGWSRADFPNVTNFFDKVFPDPEEREILRDKIMADIASGDPERMIWEDLEVTTKNGEKRIVTARNIPIFDQNLMISTVQDFTERKKLETQLQQSQKMESIGILAGGIAHDFNNILASIMGFTELAIDDAKTGTMQEENLQEVYTASKRARDLVWQILAFARQTEEPTKPVKVGTVVSEVLKLIRSSIPATIEIDQNIKSASRIMGNETELHQILMNLFTNAAQAMEGSGGVLSVALDDVEVGYEQGKSLRLSPGPHVRFSIVDTGCGIAPELIDSVFDPYFTTKEVGEGTGMGLAMVLGIVQKYNGAITVESTVGAGTTFVLYLPVTHRGEIHHLYEPEDVPGGSERILIVDDEAAIAKMTGRGLEKAGYAVTTRTGSIEALELFRSRPEDFDLVITDMTMPNMTGEVLAAEIMKVRPDIPVILCTGYTKRFAAEDASAIGIRAFVYKPIIKSKLARTVREVLDE